MLVVAVIFADLEAQLSEVHLRGLDEVNRAIDAAACYLCIKAC